MRGETFAGLTKPKILFARRAPTAEPLFRLPKKGDRQAKIGLPILRSSQTFSPSHLGANRVPLGLLAQPKAEHGDSSFSLIQRTAPLTKALLLFRLAEHAI